MPLSEKARESRLRRRARRHDLRLARSRRAADHGGYAVIDPYRNTIVYGVWGGGYEATLDEVEEWLAA